LSNEAPASAGAIVFTDIVGFTQFTAVRGDADALALLELQDRLVRDTLPPDARVVKDLGDGLMLWIPKASVALETGLDLLERFADAADEGAPLWVRMGMHWGCPTRRGDDLVGHDVNLTARILDVAGAGELLISGAVVEAARGDMRDLRCEELGPVVMRGIPDRIALYRVSRK
jgi:adenylate cyclase